MALEAVYVFWASSRLSLSLAKWRKTIPVGLSPAVIDRSGGTLQQSANGHCHHLFIHSFMR